MTDKRKYRTRSSPPTWEEKVHLDNSRAILIPGLGSAIIGIAKLVNGVHVATYDHSKCIEILATSNPEWSGVEVSEWLALQFCIFNQNAPILIDTEI